MAIKSKVGRWLAATGPLGLSVLVAMAPATVSARSPSPSPDASAGAGVLPTVRLLEPGMEPRSELRYVFRPGQSAVMVMDLEMTLAVRSDGVTVPATVIPPMRMEASFVIDDVSPAGTARYAFRYISAGVVDPGAASADVVGQMQDRLAGLVGVSGWAVVDDRGQTLDGGFSGLEKLDATSRALLDDAQASLKEMSTVLPEEPVGVGGRWVVEQHLPSQGIALVQTATFTLQGRDEDLLHLSVDVRQSAQPGPIEQPGASPGSEPQASIVQLSSIGNGTMVMSLGDLVPTSRLTTLGHTVLDVGGTSVTSDTTLSLQISPGTADARTTSSPAPSGPQPSHGDDEATAPARLKPSADDSCGMWPATTSATVGRAMIGNPGT